MDHEREKDYSNLERESEEEGGRINTLEGRKTHKIPARTQHAQTNQKRNKTKEEN